MRKILLSAIAGAAVAVVPALADKPSHPPHPPKPAKCKVRNVGYEARGTLVSQNLTQTQGAGTPTKSDDRWSGTIEVNVTRASHKAPTGDQTFTVTNIRVRWSKTTPAAGDRVVLHGKITALGKKCDQTGFTPTITIKRVEFKNKKA